MKVEDLQYEIPALPISERDFDIEKWRQETPMDYLKAMYIMNKADGICKDIIFQEIYKITRLYIPDVQYINTFRSRRIRN